MTKEDDVAKYFPRNWTGRTRVEQHELFDQMLMYLTQHELHKKHVQKIKYEEWMCDALLVMKDCTHFFAEDLYIDILIFYGLPELEYGLKDYNMYCANELVLSRLYAMYEDYYERDVVIDMRMYIGLLIVLQHIKYLLQ
ncbi:Hypothetical predicted protein [Paramuricea clavata]|uniref:Uncharacterized protein n=1 Tax=Paramuricea clavata TaxID=317549 RepID=A0A6S7HKA0_PARCT|nr:Hypothetical predicted protein [Paramuricea clavata]